MITQEPANLHPGGALRDRRVAVVRTLEEVAVAFADATEPERRELAQQTVEKLYVQVGRRADLADVLRVLVNWRRRGRPRKPHLGVIEREPPECVSKYQLLVRVFHALRLCSRHTKPRSLKRRLELDRSRDLGSSSTIAHFA